MPKRDVTGRAIEIATARLQTTLTAFRERVPLGPNKVEFSPAEFKKQLRAVQGSELLRMLQEGQLTQEQVREALEGRNGD